MISAPIWDRLVVSVLSRAFVGGGHTKLLSRGPNSLSGQSVSTFLHYYTYVTMSVSGGTSRITRRQIHQRYA